MDEKYIIEDGGPAFPIETTATPYAPGMSLRDWFAGQALANAYVSRKICPIAASIRAYEIADAMLEERNEQKEAF